ncbi:SIT4-associating protein Sap155p [[Candida] jaroonii]|uniref:SIT4-associating protein Sap155p n=1 Tax=[Candida] jaroonii TaxID=467808 RepID=A0ACA9Y9C7_9ASCO|nr:SIT4-associating protein Sap155p [[Candida] jaroonii]
MSFWPFTNSFNNNSQLQKFLDNIQDYSQVTIDSILNDVNLSQELVSELHSIKGNYNNVSNFQFSQQLQQQSGQISLASDSSSSNQVTIQIDNDSNSITSSNNDSGNNSKDPRGIKLIEVLIQPHILNGFLDYIVKSVDFFHELQVKENEELEKLLNEGSETDDSGTNSAPGEDNGNEESSEDSNVSESPQNKTESEFKEDKDEEEESHEDKLRRCIQLSAEILSIDLWIISNRILETPSIIKKLWSILYLDNLDESSPSVTHVVHILDQLMDTNSVELLNFIRSRDDLVDTFLNKLEVPMLMDFFLRIIQSDKPDKPTGIIETLYHQNLIPKLIDVLKPDISQFQTSHSIIPNNRLFFKQTAATDFIKALITISSNTALAVVVEANIGPNQLTRQLVSPKIINQMINDIMLYTVEDKANNIKLTNKHGINNCVSIIIELIRKNNSDYDLNCGSYSSLLPTHNGEATEVNSYVMFQWLKDFEQNVPSVRDPIFLGDMLTIFSDNLKNFNDLMDLEPELPTNINKDNKILGFTKFKLSELIAELLHCSNMILINSKKIKKIVEIRDKIRDRQVERLHKALNEDITDLSDSVSEISLNEEDFEDLLNGETKDFNKLIDTMDLNEESDVDEPSISSENPFVCQERDKSIRANPSIGDYLKMKLVDSNILINIVSKFTEYSWHNFFHNVVFDLIQQIFNGKLNSYNSFLISHLFNSDGYNLTKVIVEAYREDYKLRPGYLGHLILISEEVVKFTSLYKPDLISPLIVDSINSDEWHWFVNEILLKTREVYNVVLGAETDVGDDEDDDDDDDDHPKSKKNLFGFDSDNVGHLDMGSSYNKSIPKIDEVINEDDDEEEEDIMTSMSSVRIQDMSPKPEQMNDDVLSDDYDEDVGDFSHEGFQENLSESSSDDDDDDNDFQNDNKLTRVKKHNA